MSGPSPSGTSLTTEVGDLNQNNGAKSPLEVFGGPAKDSTALPSGSGGFFRIFEAHGDPFAIRLFHFGCSGG